MKQADGMIVVKVDVESNPSGGIGRIAVRGTPLFEVAPGKTVTKCQVQIGLPFNVDFDFEPRLAVAYREPPVGPEDQPKADGGQAA